jgi:tRNA pseudouridine-54 N-methylase
MNLMLKDSGKNIQHHKTEGNSLFSKFFGSHADIEKAHRKLFLVNLFSFSPFLPLKLKIY